VIIIINEGGENKMAKKRWHADQVVKRLEQIKASLPQGKQLEALEIALNYLKANEDDLDDCLDFETS